MSKSNLVDLIGKVDDNVINSIINIDNEEKLQKEIIKEKYMKNKKLIKWGSLCLGCICLVIVGVFSFNKNNLLQITNPINEVENLNEMKKYLGFDVPILNKEISSYVVIGENDVANHARIIYADDTTFDMEKGNNDVSGIYGGTLIQTKNIQNIQVKYYQYENTNYIIWSSNNYSYSYSSLTELNNDDILELINLTK